MEDKYSLFFSGCEPSPYYNVIKGLSNNMLITYVHFTRKNSAELQKRCNECPNIRFLVDSGAFTFIQENNKKPVKKSIEQWEKYIENYVAFIRKNREHIFAAVDFDIDDIVGSEQVAKWREKYFEPLKQEGIQIIYMWHLERGLDNLEQLCKRHNYIGFSLGTDGGALTEEDFNKIFKITRKYKTKVHGMAVTGTRTLTKYPFYSTDSSAWLTGAQYGEITVFENGKLHRLKKDVWKTQYKNRLINIGGNWALLDREDGYEIQRMCVLAFLEMEKYVNRLMKPKQYWREKGKLKLIKRKIKVNELERGTLPEEEWFNGEMNDWRDYAKALGIDTNIEDSWGKAMVKTFYDMINGNDEPYETETIYSLCDDFELDRKETNSRAKALRELKKCFTAHANGELETYSYLSKEDEEEEVQSRAKEREDYDEPEPNYVVMDIDKKECDSILAGFLPEKGMPEVDAYDAELDKQGIEVVRDENGKFIKGQQKIRKPKSLISKAMPKFSCDTCFKGESCPEYKAGYVCKFDKTFSSFNTRDKDELIDAAHSLAQIQLGRAQKAIMFENMDSGLPSKATTEMMELAMKYTMLVKELETSSFVATQKTVMHENGRVETTQELRSNPMAGGILSRIFANNVPAKEEEKEPIDITPNEKEEESE